MGILNRLFTLTQAAANELLDKLEDPTMMLNQYVRNMQNEIANVQHELLKQEALAKGLQQQALEASALADHSESKALEAMRAGQEAHARDALAAKLHYAEKAQEYGAWHDKAKQQIAELSVRLEAAKAELPHLIKKRDELVARIQQTAAKARTGMPSFNAGPAHLDGGSASRGFQRIEDKIAQWEAHVAASRTPYPANTGISASAYPAAEKASLVDEQMELLRKKLPTE
ncbi:PspA/IM30 family protein [Paenibacillus sp. R14(2021)]|uniref:PspA/IM30 family protein n=1 Tax=Paenibacillus sp. R14(2021) TaxID=2859228 RepID=UPI001C612291|nr:PspA/IM30 family protein [Paenibacillus sp. R14(2021)]